MQKRTGLLLIEAVPREADVGVRQGYRFPRLSSKEAPTIQVLGFHVETTNTSFRAEPCHRAGLPLDAIPGTRSGGPSLQPGPNVRTRSCRTGPPAACRGVPARCRFRRRIRARD